MAIATSNNSSCLYFSSTSFTPKYTNLPFYPSLLPSKPRSTKTLCCLSINSKNAHATTTTDGIHNNAAVDSLRVVFAAGGTGGHIYPAVAIADELNFHHPNTQTLFIGTSNSMESTAIPSAGYDFAAVFAIPLFRPFLSINNLLLPYQLIKSIAACYTILKRFNPDVVVGTGGYVSFPVCLAALLIRGVKFVIQEQNSVPGIANWVLSLFADVVFVAFNSSIECFPRKGDKFLVCGNPVRLSLRRYVSKAVARLQFFARSSDESKVVLVLGGSLGANAVNIALLHAYYELLLEHKNWYIIWQTGVEAYDEMESLFKNHQNVLLTSFLHSMDLAYAAADLVVSRAGAMTCSEILATGKPSILIPSPNVAEGHQFKNASLMADVAGSKVINEDELDSTTLRYAIEEILGNEALMAEMSERALKAAKPDASAEIAQHILSLFNLSTSKK